MGMEDILVRRGYEADEDNDDDDDGDSCEEEQQVGDEIGEQDDDGESSWWGDSMTCSSSRLVGKTTGVATSLCRGPGPGNAFVVVRGGGHKRKRCCGRGRSHEVQLCEADVETRRQRRRRYHDEVVQQVARRTASQQIDMTFIRHVTSSQYHDHLSERQSWHFSSCSSSLTTTFRTSRAPSPSRRRGHHYRRSYGRHQQQYRQHQHAARQEAHVSLVRLSKQLTHYFALTKKNRDAVIIPAHQQARQVEAPRVGVTSSPRDFSHSGPQTDLDTSTMLVARKTTSQHMAELVKMDDSSDSSNSNGNNTMCWFSAAATMSSRITRRREILLLEEALDFSSNPRLLVEADQPHRIVHANAAYGHLLLARGLRNPDDKKLAATAGSASSSSYFTNEIMNYIIHGGDDRSVMIYPVWGSEGGETFSHHLVELTTTVPDGSITADALDGGLTTTVNNNRNKKSSSVALSTTEGGLARVIA